MNPTPSQNKQGQSNQANNATGFNQNQKNPNSPSQKGSVAGAAWSSSQNDADKGSDNASKNRNPSEIPNKNAPQKESPTSANR